jgi:hypothetical protein
MTRLVTMPETVARLTREIRVRAALDTRHHDPELCREIVRCIAAMSEWAELLSCDCQDSARQAIDTPTDVQAVGDPRGREGDDMKQAEALVGEIGNLAREMMDEDQNVRLAIWSRVDEVFMVFGRYMQGQCIECGLNDPYTSTGGIIYVRSMIAGRWVNAIQCEDCWHSLHHGRVPEEP